jgi:hypothetical protein
METFVKIFDKDVAQQLIEREFSFVIDTNNEKEEIYAFLNTLEVIAAVKQINALIAFVKENTLRF